MNKIFIDDSAFGKYPFSVNAESLVFSAERVFAAGEIISNNHHNHPLSPIP